MNQSLDPEVLLEVVKTTLEQSAPLGPGLTMGPEVFDVRRLPQTKRDRHFCLDLGETSNGNLYRDADYVQDVHTLIVRVMTTLKPASQFVSQKDALRIERRIKGALVQQVGGALIQQARVAWVRSRRTFLDGFILTEITFRVEHNERLVVTAA